jgi:hypothetical protein
MESRDYQEGFENFLQEKADQYKLYPSDRVWNAINAKLHPRPRWTYLVVAAIFIGLGVGGKIYDSSLVTESLAYAEKDVPKTSWSDIQKTLNESRARVVAMTRKSSLPTLSGSEGVPRADVPVTSDLESNIQERSTPKVSQASVTDPGSVQLSSLNTGSETRAIAMEERETDFTSVQEETGIIDTENIAVVDKVSPLTGAGNQILDEAALQEALDAGELHTNTIATVSSLSKKKFSISGITAPEKANSIKVLKPRHLKIGWQLYASPTVSYRKLSGEGMSYYNNNSLNSVFTADVEKSVKHKPAVGFELGTALTYATSPKFRFKTGLQLNINRYDIQAFSYVPEVAPLTLGGIGHTRINAISTFRNYNGFSKTWLKNQHIMMSVPLGAELTLFGNENVKFNIGGTLQPTFVLNNQAYMISTNMKNYAKEPSLYKNFNVAAGAEAYLSIKSGSLRWMVGPQFRYQIFSSYKKEYPINEHLTDYGFKVGISR